MAAEHGLQSGTQDGDGVLVARPGEHLVQDPVDQRPIGFAQVEGTPDESLAAVIDGALMATAFAVPLQRAVLAMQQQPSTHRLFAESEERHAAGVTAAEDAVRALFRARGAADPALEEVMLRSTLEGVFVKFAVYGDTYPLEDARRWLHRLYGLPEPAAPLPLETRSHEGEPRPRASGAVCPGLGD